MGSGSTLHLFFGDHVHAFDATQKDAGTAKILEPQHRPRAALDRPMVLLYEIVEKLGLADPDGRFAMPAARIRFASAACRAPVSCGVR